MNPSEFDFSKASVIVKTLRDYESVVAQILKESFQGIEVLAKPLNFSGLVLVKADVPVEEITREIKMRVPEAERVLPIKYYAPAEMDLIVDAVKIIGPHAYIGVVDGSEFQKKMRPPKFEIREYFKKVSLVQMPYLGSLKASYEMGVRIGREAQTFEVGELVIAPIGIIKADEIGVFLKGVFKGIESRFQVQVKSYAHKPHRTEVYVQNLYELIRERSREPIIVFEPEGEPVSSVSVKLAELAINNRRINLLVGSREGIPIGIFRFANLVVDLCPGVTIATDLAAASALIALAFAIHQKLSSDF